MRIIEEHKVNPANDKLEIRVVDEPGSGGANHRYEVVGFDTQSNPSMGDEMPWQGNVLLFQNGPISEAGVNGLTHEVLLAILADRMRAFQAGPYACVENAVALKKIEEAQYWLQQRTKARMARAVEGTHAI